MKWVMILLLTSVVLTAQTVRPPYSSFESITRNNIFDGMRGNPMLKTQSTNSVSFSCVGTLLTNGMALAFFDSKDTNYVKVLKTNDVIADFRVVKINYNTVTLNDTQLECIVHKEFIIKVGGEMIKYENYPWTLK